ncbi:hypothetical protein Aperf_G00000030114 [Anoplocephala perfoliata]
MSSDFDLPPMLNSTNSEFALATIKDRLPIILVKALDDLLRFKKEYGNPQTDFEDVKTAISEIAKLRYELMTNKSFAILSPDSKADDIGVYNNAIQNYNEANLAWFTAPWLFVECYMYRRLFNIVCNCGLSSLDIFHERKVSSFTNSLPSLVSMCELLENAISSNHPESPLEDLKLFLSCSLWSNEFDLSLQAGEVHSYVDIGASQLKADINSKITNQMVVNDLDQVVAHWPPKDSPRTVVLVMDNASPEMFADLVLSEFLLSAGLVERVVFMPKCIPWFVSDVTGRDFEWLLKGTLPGSCEHLEKIRPWLERWSQRFSNGSFVTEVHEFWTLPFGYNEMECRAPNLYHQLTNGCNVVIFKGDLNYRKLLEDRSWAPDSEEVKLKAFKRCFPQKEKECGSLMMALRVSKSDVAVGLTPERLQEVRACDPQWWIKGLYGFIQIIR